MTLSSNQSSHQTPAQPLRLLYVEDDYLLRGVVLKFLKREGYSVETAWDGADGFQKFNEARATPQSAFDIIITDLRMPRLDGVGLIGLIREARCTVPVIVYSSSIDQRTMEELEALAVSATLPKNSPFEKLTELLETVVRPQI